MPDGGARGFGYFDVVGVVDRGNEFGVPEGGDFGEKGRYRDGRRHSWWCRN